MLIYLLKTLELLHIVKIIFKHLDGLLTGGTVAKVKKYQEEDKEVHSKVKVLEFNDLLNFI